VLDLLGFEQQVIFASYCATALFPLRDRDLRRAGIRAHNRAMAEFCAADRRLLGVGLLALDDPDRALEEIERGRGLGLRLLWIPAEAPGGRSPGHPALDPVWARLAELGLPFILHVGSAPLSIEPEWMNDGHPERPSARGQAEVVGSKDMTVIYQAAERFVSVLILDGVLERFPRLRGGVIEMGAGWVPAMLRRLDQVAEIWRRPEPHLASFTRTPSEQARAQLRFTPYPFEDVGRLIRESAPELYLFSTDYPHAEGGRDPLRRFDRSLEGCDDATRRGFYAGNFRELFPA
jgi:predicted TIM-barrel fold metal-dependent hydrolase